MNYGPEVRVESLVNSYFADFIALLLSTIYLYVFLVIFWKISHLNMLNNANNVLKLVP